MKVFEDVLFVVLVLGERQTTARLTNVSQMRARI